MAQQSPPRNLADDMVKLWQAWMFPGLNAMQRAMWAFPPGTRPSEPTAEVSHQIEKAVRASLEAAQIPSSSDLEQLSEKVDDLRTAFDTMRTDLAGVEALVRRQQDTLQAIERAVREPAGLRHEIEAAIGSYWQDRMAGVMRSLDELRQRVESLSPGTAGSQTTEKTPEQTTQLGPSSSQKAMRGKRGASKKAESQ